MKVIVAVAPGHGHLYPTFGLANEMVSRGHIVVYAMVDDPTLRAPSKARATSSRLCHQRWPTSARSWTRGPAKNPTLAGIFGPLAPPAVGPLVELIAERDARLVLHDMASFAAPLAAVVSGVPSVHIGVGPSFPDDARDAGKRLAPLWQEWGQRADELAGMFRLAYFDPFPPSLDNPARSLGMPRYSYHPVSLKPLSTEYAPQAPSPPWVWVTLGTVFNKDQSVWDQLAAELAPLDVQVLVTLGEGVEPGPLLRSAPNVVVRSFVPASYALAGASAVLCHGGAGTLLGIPSVRGCRWCAGHKAPTNSTMHGRVKRPGLELRWPTVSERRAHFRWSLPTGAIAGSPTSSGRANGDAGPSRMHKCA